MVSGDPPRRTTSPGGCQFDPKRNSGKSEYRLRNIEFRVSTVGILSSLIKLTEQSETTLRHSAVL